MDSPSAARRLSGESSDFYSGDDDSANEFAPRKTGRIPAVHIIGEDDLVVTSVRLGEGAFASVYRGLWHGTEVAVKRIHEKIQLARLGGKYVDMFMKECWTGYSLRHPNIVCFYGIYRPGTTDVSIVTEIMEMSLRTRYRMEPSLTLPQVTDVGKQVAAALVYLHSRDIVHRDLTPMNILLKQSTRGLFYEAKVGDYASAKILQSIPLSYSLTSLSGCLVTVPYLPREAVETLQPEDDEVVEVFLSRRRRCIYDIAIDVYSLGVVLTEVLRRREPPYFPDKKAEWLAKLGQNHDLFSLLEKCLASDRHDRPTASVVHQKLSNLLLKKVPSATEKAKKSDVGTNQQSLVASLKRPFAEDSNEQVTTFCNGQWLDMPTTSLLQLSQDQCRQAVACGSEFLVVLLNDGSLYACSTYWGKWQRLSPPFSNNAYYAIARCGRSLWAVACSFQHKSDSSGWTLHCQVKRTAFQRCTMPTWPDCYSYSDRHNLLLPAAQGLPSKSHQSTMEYSGFAVAALPNRSAQTAELIIAGGIVQDGIGDSTDHGSTAFMGAVIVNSSCGVPLKIIGSDSIPFEVGWCATIVVHKRTIFVLDKMSAIIGYAKLQVESTPDNMPCSFRFQGWKRLPLPARFEKCQGVDMAILKDHLILIGGDVNQQCSNAVYALAISSCDDASFKCELWRQCPPMLHGRSGHATCINTNDELFVLGGLPGSGQLTVEHFVTPEWTCTEV